MEEFLAYGLIITIAGIFAMRWLLSWWVRITDVLRELRTQNQRLATMIQLQRDTINAIQVLQYVEQNKPRV
jgi:hypothetical protein